MTSPSTGATLPAPDSIDRIAALAKASIVPCIIPEVPTQIPVLQWADKSRSSLEHLLAAPTAKRGFAMLADTASFIDYVLRHSQPGTIIAGNYTETAGHFVAILDHHRPNDAAPENTATVVATSLRGWSDHQARLDLIATPEWKRWVEITSKLLSQVEFALFLEENAEDVNVPAVPADHGIPAGIKLPGAADLMDIATTLSVQTDSKFNSGIRLDNGATQLTYNENVQGQYGGEKKLPVPNLFCIAVAPFLGGPKFLVQVRLRYRASGGKAAFILSMVRPHKVVELAWTEHREQIEKQTGARVLRGAIEPQTRHVPKAPAF